MIKVTCLDKKEKIINADLIEFIESTPDTLISLTTGKKLMVLESVADIISRAREYKSKIFSLFLDERSGNGIRPVSECEDIEEYEKREKE